MSKLLLSEDNADRFKRRAYELKLQVAEATETGAASRAVDTSMGAHPQRCLCVADGQLRFEKGWWSPTATDTRWRIHYLDALAPSGETVTVAEAADEPAFPALCFLQNVKSNLFLAVRDGEARAQIGG